MSRRTGERRLRTPVIAVAAIGLMVSLLVAPAANASPPPESAYHGGRFKITKPEAALTASWWQEFVALPGPNALDQCGVGTRKVTYLAGTTGTPATRSCATDKTNTFLVPLINAECSEAENNGTTFAALRSCANVYGDNFTDLHLVIDGRPVHGLGHLRVKATSTFTPVQENVFGIPPAANSKFAADGYWALIKLSPGEHTLVFGGSYPPGPFTTLATYHLTVEK